MDDHERVRKHMRRRALVSPVAAHHMQRDCEVVLTRRKAIPHLSDPRLHHARRFADNGLQGLSLPEARLFLSSGYFASFRKASRSSRITRSAVSTCLAKSGL